MILILQRGATNSCEAMMKFQLIFLMVIICFGLCAPTPPGGDEPARCAPIAQNHAGDHDVALVLPLRRSQAVTPVGFLTDADLERLRALPLGDGPQ